MTEQQNQSIASTDNVVLEAEWSIPDAPTALAVITHPHPLHGGNMYAHVNAALYNQAIADGIAALRFNFRGAGRSTGQHDNGIAEQHDVGAAVEHLVGELPDLPLVLAGWSFGADMALTSTHPAVAGWFLVAPPLSFGDQLDQVGSDPRPKHLMVPENDQFNPPPKAQATTNAWQNATIEVVDGADHFLAANTTQLTASFSSFAATLR